jgi:uncharacterized protein (TIGR02246 family)
MMYTKSMSALLAAALFFGASQAAWPQSGQGSGADVAAIKEVFRAFYESFTRHDPHGVAMTFTDNADFTNMRGVHNKGRAEIEQKFVALFKGNLGASTRTDIVKNIHFYTPELATAEADTTILNTLRPDGSVVPPRKGLMIATMVKQNGDWLIDEFHEVEFPEPRSASAP